MRLTFEDALVMGIIENNVNSVTGYPGFPVTNIFEKIAQKVKEGFLKKCLVRWCINETVALENAMGASFVDARSIVLMKNHGTNTVQDVLINFSYIGVRGGILLISADDTEVRASQNETDSRVFGPLNKIPVLEPASVEDAYSFINSGLRLSEKYKTPVILRITGGQLQQEGPLIHPGVSKCKLDDQHKFDFCPERQRFFIGPHYYTSMKKSMLKRIHEIAGEAQGDFNKIFIGTGDVGLICSGEFFEHFRNLFPSATVLRLGLVYPISRLDLESFFSIVTPFKEIYVVEQTEPVIETQVKEYLYQLACQHGKEPQGKTVIVLKPPEGGVGPVGPVNAVKLCPACPARSILISLKELDIKVVGDAGCTALGCLPPFESVHVGACMGSSIAIAAGINHLSERKVVALIGDSAFFHSGMQGLLNEIDSSTNLFIILFNNKKAGMTGGQVTTGGIQEIPGSSGKIARMLFNAGLRKENIKVLKNALNFHEVKKAIFNYYHNLQGLRVLIVDGTCCFNLKDFLNDSVKKEGHVKVIKGEITDPGCFAFEKEAGHTQKIYKMLCGSCRICEWLDQLN